MRVGPIRIRKALIPQWVCEFAQSSHNSAGPWSGPFMAGTPPRNTHADHVKSIAQGRGGCVVAIISVVVPSGVCAE